MNITHFESECFAELQSTLQQRSVTQQGADPVVLKDGRIAVLLWSQSGETNTAVGLVVFRADDNSFDRAELIDDFAEHEKYVMHLVSNYPEVGKTLLDKQRTF